MAGSIMPAGLADELTRPELVDLVRFLSELGKVGPYRRGDPARLPALAGPRADAGGPGGPGPRRPGGRAPRRPEAHLAAGLHDRRRAPAALGVGDPARAANRRSVALARTQIQVTTGGPVKLSLDSTGGLSLLSRRPSRRAGPGAGRRGRLVLDLAPGVHTLAVAIPGRSSRRDPLYPGGRPGLAGPGAGRPGEMSREEPEHRDRGRVNRSPIATVRHPIEPDASVAARLPGVRRPAGRAAGQADLLAVPDDLRDVLRGRARLIDPASIKATGDERQSEAAIRREDRRDLGAHGCLQTARRRYPSRGRSQIRPSSAGIHAGRGHSGYKSGSRRRR